MIVPKKFGIKTIVGVGVFAVVIYGTCFGGFSRIMDAIDRHKTAPVRAQFERLLEDKYGEKFVCFDACKTGSYAFNPSTACEGFCAPKRNTNLVFKVRTTVGKDSKLTYDRYPAAIAEHQLTKEFSKELDGVFGRYIVTCRMGAYEDNDEVIKQVKDGTLNWEFYYTECPSVNGSTHRSITSFHILIDSSELKGNYEDE